MRAPVHLRIWTAIAVVAAVCATEGCALIVGFEQDLDLASPDEGGADGGNVRDATTGRRNDSATTSEADSAEADHSVEPPDSAPTFFGWHLDPDFGAGGWATLEDEPVGPAFFAAGSGLDGGVVLALVIAPMAGTVAALDIDPTQPIDPEAPFTSLPNAPGTLQMIVSAGGDVSFVVYVDSVEGHQTKPLGQLVRLDDGGTSSTNGTSLPVIDACPKRVVDVEDGTFTAVEVCDGNNGALFDVMTAIDGSPGSAARLSKNAPTSIAGGTRVASGFWLVGSDDTDAGSVGAFDLVSSDASDLAFATLDGGSAALTDVVSLDGDRALAVGTSGASFVLATLDRSAGSSGFITSIARLDMPDAGDAGAFLPEPTSHTRAVRTAFDETLAIGALENEGALAVAGFTSDGGFTDAFATVRHRVPFPRASSVVVNEAIAVGNYVYVLATVTTTTSQTVIGIARLAH